MEWRRRRHIAIHTRPQCVPSLCSFCCCETPAEGKATSLISTNNLSCFLLHPSLPPLRELFFAREKWKLFSRALSYLPDEGVLGSSSPTIARFAFVVAPVRSSFRERWKKKEWKSVNSLRYNHDSVIYYFCRFALLIFATSTFEML